MSARTRKNVLLIELIIVIFFFSISAATTLQVFGHAYIKSDSSANINAALNLVQDWAEQISLSGDPEGMLSEAGWQEADGLLRITAGEKYYLTAFAERGQTAAGALVRVQLSVFSASLEDAPPIFTMPIVCYIPDSGVGA